MYSRNLPLNTEPRYNLINGLVNAFNRIKTTEHTESTNLQPDEHFTGDSFHGETLSFPGLTLKHASKSLRMVPLERTNTTSY